MIQLTEPQGYDTKMIQFSDPKSGSIPTTPIKFHRIQIRTKYSDGKTGDLILPTSRLYSLGLQEYTNEDPNKMSNFSMPLCLWGKDNYTEEEKTFTDTFEKIVDKCSEHIINIKKEIKKNKIEKRDLTKLNPLKWKEVEGEGTGIGPILSPKLIISKNTKI